MAANVRTKRSSSSCCCDPPLSVVNLQETSSRRLKRRIVDKLKKQSQSESNPLIQIVAMYFSTFARGAVIVLGAIAIHSAVNFTKSTYYYTSNSINASNRETKLHIPSGLDDASRRALSLHLGGGDCLWQPPVYDVPDNIDFHKTAIVGFPSGDKRMIFIQMEALTGWPAKDEWDFEYLGDSNHPFIKANYPHHEGIWGWGTNADQVVMMVRNIRKSMVEYHDILWDIGYAKTWEEATLNIGKLYGERPPIEDFFEWRDLRVLDEVHWYGWFIDYWMEGGLMRDMFTHKLTTPEHWNMLMMPTKYTRAELDYDLVVGADTVVEPSYDPHCQGDVSGGCQPVAVISAEKLREHDVGAAETTKIANVLTNNAKMSPYVIDSEAWDCIWKELIQNGKGLKTVVDRVDASLTEADYNFSAEMLQEMITELDRLIAKYSSSEWNALETANRIVELITEHRGLVQTELDDLNSGRRKLSARDFLGPKERERRRQSQVKDGLAGTKPNTKYFDAMANERMIMKMRKADKAKIDRKAQRKDERIAERKSLRRGESHVE